MAGEADPVHIAQEFHTSYEKLAAVVHGTAQPSTWDQMPESYRNLIVAVVEDLIDRGVIGIGHSH